MNRTIVITAIEQLRGLQQDWDALAADFGTPLLEHAWFASIAEAFRGARLHVVVVTRAGALVAAAPLSLRVSSWAGPRLGLLGATPLYEPSGWLYGRREDLTALADAVVGTGHPLVLHRIPADSPVRSALTELTPRRALMAARPVAPSLYVSTAQHWETYCAGLSRHVTGNLPRLRRRAERDVGAVRTAHLEPHESEMDQLLDAFVSIEASGWKSRAGSALGQRPEMLDFFRRYCRRTAQAGTLRVTTLSFGAELAAMELAVQAYDRKWQLKIAYHERFAAYYPGLQLVEASIRDGFERGLAAYEFLGVSEDWEYRWRPEERHYQVLAVYPLSAQGMAAACRDAAGSAWRAVWRSGVGAAQ